MKLINKTSKAYKPWEADFQQFYHTYLSGLDWNREDVQEACAVADDLGFFTTFKKERKNGRRILARVFNRFNETQAIIVCSR